MHPPTTAAVIAIAMPLPRFAIVPAIVSPPLTHSRTRCISLHWPHAYRRSCTRRVSTASSCRFDAFRPSHPTRGLSLVVPVTTRTTFALSCSPRADASSLAASTRPSLFIQQPRSAEAGHPTASSRRFPTERWLLLHETGSCCTDRRRHCRYAFTSCVFMASHLLQTCVCVFSISNRQTFYIAQRALSGMPQLTSDTFILDEIPSTLTHSLTSAPTHSTTRPFSATAVVAPWSSCGRHRRGRDCSFRQGRCASADSSSGNTTRVCT
jgi:hypothetical protein